MHTSMGSGCPHLLVGHYAITLVEVVLCFQNGVDHVAGSGSNDVNVVYKGIKSLIELHLLVWGDHLPWCCYGLIYANHAISLHHPSQCSITQTLACSIPQVFDAVCIILC